MDKEQLYTLITRGNANELDTALQSGLDVNSTLPNGNQMIITAACMGDARLDMVKILVKYGADINTPMEGMTLLKWIKQPYYSDNERIIAFLEEKGAKEADL